MIIQDLRVVLWSYLNIVLFMALKAKHFLSLLQIFGNSSRYHVIAITSSA